MRRLPVTTYALTVLLSISLSAVLWLPAASAHADASSCRAQIARVAGAFAKHRMKLIARCEESKQCDAVELAAKLTQLKEKSQRKLRSKCSAFSNGELGLGETCPDPSGRCTQTLDSQQAIIDCVLCMVEETVDPLLRRLRGSHAHLAQTCGGCSATPCAPEYFCETRPGHCEDDTDVGICVEVPTACPEIFEPVCGCNGVTYQNNCMRKQARTALFHEGPCVTFCDGTSGNTCPEGTTCAALPGHCDDTSDEGICVPIPDDCEGEEWPLCGCDGVTYANECALREAGVRLDHIGTCEESRCNEEADCAEGLFCELPPEICDPLEKPGVCLPKPDACTDEFEPVCGCDGVTYGNNCERRRAGVPILHHGSCREVCGGTSGVPCDAGEFCELPPKRCEETDLEGHCVEIPEGCPTHLEPVCGCNGVTYGNDCERQVAGAQLAHYGPCLELCDPEDPNACGEEGICLTPPGHCDLFREAVCVPQPTECPMELLGGPFPVCGCDGVTYPSLCEMLLAGVSLADEGPCPKVCGGISGVPCDAGEFCELPPKQCEVADLEGHCVEIPEACPAHVEPVCGCNGVTYGNDCERQVAGAQLAHHGPCLDVCDPEDPNACGEEGVCLTPPGHCDLFGEAVCVPRPVECPMELLGEPFPVCGCDGVTYPSLCEMLLAGVSLADEGPCPAP